MLPDRILVATDGSPDSIAAEEYAVELAAVTPNARIVVLHVLQQLHTRDPQAYTKAETHTDDVVAEAAARVRTLVGDRPISVETKVLTSVSPADAIIAEAHAEGTCSSVVLGSRGLGGFASLLLGSVSHHVAQGLHCPCTIIRA